jgi:ABC-type dipeptide/oligopeptide/nickel transport system permease subunit
MRQASDQSSPLLGHAARGRANDLRLGRPQRALRLLGRVLATRLVGSGLAVLGLVCLGALLSPLLAPYNPNDQDYLAFTQGPSSAHWLGTDDLGRDVLSRLIYGSRVSLQVGIIAVGIAVTVGVSLGLLAGYAGGFTDTLITRFTDAVQAFPGLILALAITAALGPGIGNAMIAIGFVSTPAIARLTRGQTLSIREREYVEAARVLGASPLRIMARHIWPNVTAPIIVQATLLVASAIVTEASLSFLGVGVQPPTASWGAMLRTGSQYLEVAPWMAFAPGVAIFLTVLAFNFVGDGLRQALDPRLGNRR